MNQKSALQPLVTQLPANNRTVAHDLDDLFKAAPMNTVANLQPNVK